MLTHLQMADLQNENISELLWNLICWVFLKMYYIRNPWSLTLCTRMQLTTFLFSTYVLKFQIQTIWHVYYREALVEPGTKMGLNLCFSSFFILQTSNRAKLKSSNLCLNYCFFSEKPGMFCVT